MEIKFGNHIIAENRPTFFVIAEGQAISFQVEKVRTIKITSS